MSASNSPLPPASSATPADPTAPRLSAYQLTGLIGSGSVGEVHRAIDVASGQVVALKLMRLPVQGGAVTEDARRTFHTEAAAAARLQHPGIVRILAAGEEAGRAWIAMELLGGHDLQRRTRAGALLPPATVLAIVQRIAAALGYAHRQGVLHRDIKPANVLLDLAADRVTLTDFGLARLADAERTRTGLLLGTPAYMAPELLAGEPASAASDLYALGVLLFELLAGRRPHQAASMGALLRQVAREPAPALSTLRRGLPAGVSELVASLLAKQAAARPADAADVADGLAAMARQAPAAGPAR